MRQNGKYLGYRKQGDDLLTLNLVEDRFVELMFTLNGHKLVSIELLQSDEALDLYIDSMLMGVKKKDYIVLIGIDPPNGTFL